MKVKTLGQELSKVIDFNNYPRELLAPVLKCNRIHLTQLLNGRRMLSPDEIVRLARHTQVSTSNIITWQTNWLTEATRKSLRNSLGL